MNSSPISTVITSEAMLRTDKLTRRFALFKSLQTSIIQVSESSCLLVFVYLSAARAIRRLAKTIRILLVQLCCTFGAAMLHCWYSYAGPLVYLCWTFGTRMLYSSGTVFSICLLTISRWESEWRMKKRSSAAEGKANEELSAVGRLRNKVRRPNFVS